MQRYQIGRILQQVGGALSGGPRRGTPAAGDRTRNVGARGYRGRPRRGAVAPGGGVGRIVSRFLRG